LATFLLMLFPIIKGVVSEKPNVIFFLIDDLGIGDVPWNNADIKMPFTTDTLLPQGKILTQAYTAQLCSPSRGALMSGYYPHKVGMSHVAMQGSNSDCLKTDVKLLPEKLKDEGYETHMLGKWHLGYCSIDCLPHGRGFDTFYGYFHGTLDHYTRVANHGNHYDWHDLKVGDGDKNTTDYGKPYNDTFYTHDLMTERALEIIDNSTEPLFMYFSTPLVHTPMQVPDHYLARVPADGLTNDTRILRAMLLAIDDSMELIINKLKAKGMYNNSVFIFQSDNGGDSSVANNGLYRGAKFSLYEGGVLTPAFIHSPLMETKEFGTTSEGLFYISDWHTTILEMAGYGKDSSKLDGISQVDFLFKGDLSKRSQIIHTLDIYYPQSMGEAAIRVGKYKLIIGYPGSFDGYGSNGTLTQAYDYDFYNTNQTYSGAESNPYRNFVYGQQYLDAIGDDYQMYDIEKDPYETTDISKKFRCTYQRLKRRLFAEKKNFFKFNLDGHGNFPEGMPGAGEPWFSGWCPDGPKTMDV